MSLDRGGRDDQSQWGGGPGSSKKRRRGGAGDGNRPTGRGRFQDGKVTVMSEEWLHLFGEWRRHFAQMLSADENTTLLGEHLDGYETGLDGR